MSSDRNAGKENDKAGDSRQEKRSLQTPDAHEARTADRATIHDVEKQNKDSWQSEHGVFAIVDNDQVLASKQVSDRSEAANPQAKPLDTSGDKPVGGYEVEHKGKDRLLFKLGVSNVKQDENLTTDQISLLASENKTAEAGKQM